MSQQNVELVQRSLDHSRGHDRIRTLLGGIAVVFDEVRLEADELVDAGDSVVILGRFRVRGGLSGATGTQPIALVTQLRAGRLVAYHRYFRREDALEAVGLVTSWEAGLRAAETGPMLAPYGTCGAGRPSESCARVRR